MLFHLNIGKGEYPEKEFESDSESALIRVNPKKYSSSFKLRSCCETQGCLSTDITICVLNFDEI